jgi:hypothetical protein
MTDIAGQPLALTSTRFARWTRIVAVTFGVLVLVALSFTLGRVTMGDTGHAPAPDRPAVMQPAGQGGGEAATVCQPRRPC